MPNQSRQLKRINLVKRRKLRKGMDSVSWYIGKEVNNKTFYIAEHDKEENTTMWTPDREQAMLFRSERNVHRFIKRYLPKRTDIMLVSVQVKEN
jgi:hypothetical protein